MRPPIFVSLVDDYLALRRDLGFDVERQRWLLRDFARYADRAGHRGPITVDLAVRWAVSSCPGDPARTERRLGAVRMFARHRAAFDSATEVPPAGLFGRIPRRQQAHIYSTLEISALLRECRLLRLRDGLRPRTYVAFFSLLASTGLRLSEARRLERGDVDLAKGLLTVRAGKFPKSRLVPLHPSSVQALARYVRQRDAFRFAPRSEFFFRTDHAPALQRAAVEKTFSRLRDPGSTRSSRLPTPMGATSVSSPASPALMSSSSTTSRSVRSRSTAAAISSRSWRTGRASAPRSSPASCRRRSGTTTSRIRPWPMHSVTACFTRPTGLR